MFIARRRRESQGEGALPERPAHAAPTRINWPASLFAITVTTAIFVAACGSWQSRTQRYAPPAQRAVIAVPLFLGLGFKGSEATGL